MPIAASASRRARAATFWFAVVVGYSFLIAYLIQVGRDQATLPGPATETALLFATYERVLDRIQHFENMLVTIGTVSLAILAAVSGLVFTKDFTPAAVARAETSMSEDDEQAQNDRTYRGIVILTLLTTVAYTHVFRYYCLTFAYACELEMRLAATDVRARMSSSIWHDMSAGAVPWAGVTFSFVGLYSVAISVAMIVLFGSRFRQSWGSQVVVLVFVTLAALIYVVPPVSHYLSMVELAQAPVGR